MKECEKGRRKRTIKRQIKAILSALITANYGIRIRKGLYTSRELRIIVLYMVLGVEVGIGVDKNNSCVHMTVQTGEMKRSQSVLWKKEYTTYSFKSTSIEKEK